MGLLTVWMLACAWEPADGGAAATGANDGSAGAAASGTVVVTAAETEELREELRETRRALEGVDDRLSRLELLVAEMQHVGIGQADRVRYDPSRSELGGRSVQEALDELTAMIRSFETPGEMGEFSEDLLRMHQDDGPMGGARLAGGQRKPPPQQQRQEPEGPPPGEEPMDHPPPPR